MRKLVSIGRLGALTEGRAQLVVGPDGKRFACVRRGEGVAVVDDRCPHQGHPLSLGLVRDGVLTCPFHNWKFELPTGRCVHGGEGVRSYAAELLDGELFVDLAQDEASERARADDELASALRRGSLDGALRGALRLARLGGAAAPYERLLTELAERAPYGPGAGLVALEAGRALEAAGVLEAHEALAVAVAGVLHDAGPRAPRSAPPARPGAVDDAREFLLDLLEERRVEAEARVRGLPAEITAAGIARTWLLPFASVKLWDGPLGLARVRSALSLAQLGAAEGPAGRALVAAVSHALSWSVAESDLPAWRSTRQALLDARALRPGSKRLDAARAEQFARDALVSEAQAVSAALALLRDGVDATELLRALGGAALERLARYDPARSRRVGSSTTGLEAGGAAVFIAAAQGLGPSPYGAAHAVLAAGFVGKLRRNDARVTPVPAKGAPVVEYHLEGLREALAARDVRLVRRYLRALPAGPEAQAEQRRALATLVRYAALDARGTLDPAALEAAALARAVWQLASEAPGWAPLGARALLRAVLEDAPQGLSRVAANAAHVSTRGRAFDEG